MYGEGTETVFVVDPLHLVGAAWRARGRGGEGKLNKSEPPARPASPEIAIAAGPYRRIGQSLEQRPVDLICVSAALYASGHSRQAQRQLTLPCCD